MKAKINLYLRIALFSIQVLCGVAALCADDFYVSPSGDNANDGSAASPWKTIQHAADNAIPGSVVHISAGIYSERVLINVSGNAVDGYITFLGDPAGGTIIDGTGFSSAVMESFNRIAFDAYGLGNTSALLEIIDQSYVRVQNIEIRNYACDSTNIFPMGVMVLKKDSSADAMRDIELVNLNIHDIQNKTSSSDGGAQGLAAYGGHTAVAITNLRIIGCEIHSCVLGQSESMTVNGNIDGFLIADNKVHDNDNIGIVCIGWEGTAGSINTNSDPALVGGHHPNDRARNGTVRNNLVYNCSTEKPIKNPTYPDNDFSAGGIYIDGGKDITIEYNQIYQCDVGIEIASEHGGVDDNNDQRNTSGIVCRNNLVYYCGQYGVGIGGYDSQRGDATDCKILNNTIYKCSSLGYGGGQIYINKAHHNLISGNILVARDSADVDDYDGFNNSGADWEWDHGLVLGSSLNSTYNHDNTLDSNLYYTASGSASIRWKWEMTDAQDPNAGFTSLQAIDSNAVFGDPKFVKATISKADGTENFSITDVASPAIDQADAAQIANAGVEDFAGKPRVYNAVQDIGAYEYHPSADGMEIGVFSSPAMGAPIGISDGDSTPSLVDGTEFGNIDIATGSDMRTFIIKNTGTADLSIGGISFSGAAASDFSVTTTPSAIVAPKGETTFVVTFNPSTGGERSADISIIDNDNNENPFNFSLHGTGTGVNLFTLTYLADVNGTVSGATSQIVAENTDGTAVTPIPNPGYHFTSWSDTSLDNPRIDTNVTYNLTVTANFAINSTYALTVTNGSGNGTYPEQGNIAIEGDAPVAGEHFLHWSTADGGSFADLFAPATTYAMPGNISTVTANYSVYSGLLSSATTKLIASDAAASDEFGYSVAISGDTAVIGAWRDGYVGSAYVFVKSAGVWTQQQKLTASDPAVNDFFGCSVDISGDTIVIGAFYDDDGASDTGSVYVFTRVGTTWNEQKKLTASDAAAGDHFGESVSISGNSVVVGAPGNGVGGSIYIFRWSNALWTEQAKLNGLDTMAGDAFGGSVSISADTVVAGARATDDAGTSSGSAYVFFRNGSTWSQQAKLVASDAAAGDQFGFAVSISGDSIVAGALFDDDGGLSSGSAYVFNRTGIIWAQQAKLVGSDAVAGDQFGSAVAISNDTVVVGAVGDDDIAVGSGGAYVFLRNGVDWKQQSKLKANDAAANDAFGHSTAISGENALVGAVYDSGGGSAYTYLFTPAHSLTIVNGTGDGVFLAGGVADPIVADSPAVGHHFVDWTTGDGGVIGDDKATSTNYTMPPNDAAVTANFSINTYPVTYNATANGSITGDAAQTIDYGSDASEVIATPDFGYHFVIWDDSVTTAARTDQNITTALTATANFAINVYTLTYTAERGGSLTGDVSQAITHGNDGTQVTAVVDPGYHFEGWSDFVATESRTDVNVTANINATANFALNPSYDLTVENGSGSGTYPEGSIKNVVAKIPPEGKIFKNWTVVGGGVLAGANSSATTYEMPGNDAVLTANFVIGYTLTVNDGSGDGPYEPGTAVSVSADVPAPGMQFDEWTGDVADVADVNAADTTITMPSGATAITATYKVDESVAVKLTSGSMITINAANTPGANNEFTSRPSVYGVYTDPLRLRERKSTMRAVSRINSRQPADKFKCEWNRSLFLYDRADLRNKNKMGDSTRSWLSNNHIDDLEIVLNLKTRNLSRKTIVTTVRGVQLTPPKITSVTRWDGVNPVGAFHTRSKIIIKGHYFGSRPPTVSMEYDARGAKKLQRLKVLRIYKYADAKGKSNKSCMDVDETSVTYGDSEIQVELPRTWRTGLGPGTYDLVLNNRIGVDTFPITIVDVADNANPVANDDSYDLQTGDSSYYLDVLSNDQDANSDTMTIVLASKTSDLEGRISVSKGKIRYTPPRRVLAPIADTFKYTLADEYGGISATSATVSVNIAAMSILPLENWDGNALVSVKNGGLVVIKGRNFGIKAPTVTLNYMLSGVARTLRLKVMRLPKYENYKAKANSSYTDLANGDTEIQVLMPRSWWKGWTSTRQYEIEINNKVDSAVVSIGTTSTSTAPVANNDNVTILSGERYYLIDVLANDTDAESDKVKILLPSRISNYGSRLSVDAKTNTVRYYRKKEVLCDFANDTFSYYLRNSAGLLSATVTVTVSGALNP